MLWQQQNELRRKVIDSYLAALVSEQQLAATQTLSLPRRISVE